LREAGKAEARHPVGVGDGEARRSRAARANGPVRLTRSPGLEERSRSRTREETPLHALREHSPALPTAMAKFERSGVQEFYFQEVNPNPGDVAAPA
jgi:hypothetical protein